MTATSFPKTFFDGTGTAVLRAAPVPAYPQATDSEQESLTEIKDVGQGEITEEFHLAKREDAATAPLKGRRPGLFSIQAAWLAGHRPRGVSRSGGLFSIQVARLAGRSRRCDGASVAIARDSPWVWPDPLRVDQTRRGLARSAACRPSEHGPDGRVGLYAGGRAPQRQAPQWRTAGTQSHSIKRRSRGHVQQRVAIVAAAQHAILDHRGRTQLLDQEQSTDKEQQDDDDAGKTRRLPLGRLLVRLLPQPVVMSIQSTLRLELCVYHKGSALKQSKGWRHAAYIG
jgi:hypothetical protein